MQRPSPIYSLKVITWVLILAMGVLPIIAVLEGKDLWKWFFPLMMLGCAFAILTPIIIPLDKRVKALEDQLKSSDDDMQNKHVE